MEYSREKRRWLYHKGREKYKEYYRKNRKKLIAYSKKWAKENKDQRNLRRREKYASEVNHPIRKRYPKKDKRKFKVQTFDHYGKVCLCCGENNLKLLTIDHINDNGKEHGNGVNRYKGEDLYRYLIANNFPSGLQVLCFNCNIGRRNNGGICPHIS